MNCGLGREEMGSGGQIEAAYAGLHFVRACVVIAEGESEHDRQPEDGADDDKLGALGTIACMHEVENNKGGLDRGDAESDNNVERPKFLEGGPNAKRLTNHQGR